MKRIIRLTESDFSRLVNRVINEQGELPTVSQVPQGKGMGLNTEPQRLPNCRDLMKRGNPNQPGSSAELNGMFNQISYNGTVSPQYQGYTIHKEGKPFCFIRMAV